METIEKMKAGPKKDIAMAEYRYFSGQAEKAMQDTEVYLTSTDGAIRLSACCQKAHAAQTLRHGVVKRVIWVDNRVLFRRQENPPFI